MSMIEPRLSQPEQRWLSWASQPLMGGLLLALFSAVMFSIGADSIPAIDRDEARFAQASKQMLETGNFLEIYFQDAPRNKKPPLSYWAQAGSAALFGGEDLSRIAAYRLPSMIAAGLTGILIFLLGARLVGRPAAFVAGAFYCASLGILVEVNQAKSDALLVLFSTIFLLLASQAVLGRKLTTRAALTAWAAMGLAILTKGPIAPLVALLAFCSFGVLRRDFSFFARLRPVIGVPLMLAVALPWFVAVQVWGSGNFLGDAVTQDLLPKLFSGKEQHGGLPGYYLLVSVITLFPASLFIVPALARAYQLRIHPLAGPLTLWLLCWLVPSWILFELMVTKLPHYVYPLLPALFLLVGSWLVAPAQTRSRSARWNRVAVCAVFLLALIGLFAAAAFYEPKLWLALSGSLLATLAAGLALWHLRHAPPLRFAALASGVSCIAMVVIGQGLAPSLNTFWVTRALDAERDRASVELGRPLPRVGSSFFEPSVVFTFGTKTKLAPSTELAASLQTGLIDVAILPESAKANFANTRFYGPISGFNYAGGDPLTLWLGVKADQ